uniref:(California timema) hypothetical protein n=1 Tax=Timema californicum TaxID=61474 RepID=A0A7R9P3F8_TIMCA|nr:unnamed protein product [Timema californicum]
MEERAEQSHGSRRVGSLATGPLVAMTTDLCAARIDVSATEPSKVAMATSTGSSIYLDNRLKGIGIHHPQDEGVHLSSYVSLNTVRSRVGNLSRDLSLPMCHTGRSSADERQDAANKGETSRVFSHRDAGVFDCDLCLLIFRIGDGDSWTIVVSLGRRLVGRPFRFRQGLHSTESSVSLALRPDSPPHNARRYSPIFIGKALSKTKTSMVPAHNQATPAALGGGWHPLHVPKFGSCHLGEGTGEERAKLRDMQGVPTTIEVLLSYFLEHKETVISSSQKRLVTHTVSKYVFGMQHVTWTRWARTRGTDNIKGFLLCLEKRRESNKKTRINTETRSAGRMVQRTLLASPIILTIIVFRAPSYLPPGIFELIYLDITVHPYIFLFPEGSCYGGLSVKKPWRDGCHLLSESDHDINAEPWAVPASLKVRIHFERTEQAERARTNDTSEYFEHSECLLVLDLFPPIPLRTGQLELSLKMDLIVAAATGDSFATNTPNGPNRCENMYSLGTGEQLTSFEHYQKTDSCSIAFGSVRCVFSDRFHLHISLRTNRTRTNECSMAIPPSLNILTTQSAVFLYLCESNPCILVFTTSAGVLASTDAAPANAPMRPTTELGTFADDTSPLYHSLPVSMIKNLMD